MIVGVYRIVTATVLPFFTGLTVTPNDAGLKITVVYE